MGCHTWFYKKSDLDFNKIYEEAYNYYLNKTETIIQSGIEKYNPFSDCEIEEHERYDFKYGWKGNVYRLPELINNEEYKLFRFNYVKRRNAILKTGRLKQHIVSDYLSEMQYVEESILCEKHIKVRNNTIYEEAEYHDIFRVGGYDRNILTSLDESLEYLKKKDITEYEKLFTTFVSTEYEWCGLKKVQEFWNKYPDGIIIFG